MAADRLPPVRPGAGAGRAGDPAGQARNRLSDPVAELPTTQQRVQDVAAVMAAARSSRAVLFGLSDGGRAAIAFAAAHPGRTRGLILYGTSYRGPRAALLRRYRSAVRRWGEGRLADLVAPSLTGPAGRAQPRGAGRRARGARGGKAAREAAGAFERAAASPAMAAALVESLGLIDVRDLMSSLTVPTLVLHREGTSSRSRTLAWWPPRSRERT